MKYKYFIQKDQDSDRKHITKEETTRLVCGPSADDPTVLMGIHIHNRDCPMLFSVDQRHGYEFK